MLNVTTEVLAKPATQHLAYGLDFVQWFHSNQEIMTWNSFYRNSVKFIFSCDGNRYNCNSPQKM
eukprot:872188-Amphidinium_carterae.1